MAGGWKLIAVLVSVHRGDDFASIAIPESDAIADAHHRSVCTLHVESLRLPQRESKVSNPNK